MNRIDPTGLEEKTNYLVGDENDWYNKDWEDAIEPINNTLEAEADFYKRKMSTDSAIYKPMSAWNYLFFSVAHILASDDLQELQLDIMLGCGTSRYAPLIEASGTVVASKIPKATPKIKSVFTKLDDIFSNLFTRSGKTPFKKIAQESAENVNKILSKSGYTKPPYQPGTVVETLQLTKKSNFVRVYDGVNSKQAGGWFMKAEDIIGLTPKQIQNKFALPTEPKFVTDVILDAGTNIRTGIANPLYGQNGGGTQFDLMGQYVGDFVNEKLLP